MSIGRGLALCALVRVCSGVPAFGVWVSRVACWYDLVRGARAPQLMQPFYFS